MPPRHSGGYHGDSNGSGRGGNGGGVALVAANKIY